MTPELRLLRYFVAVAQELNFTRAADQLFISQPSLSAAIRQLERQITAPLFDRDTRHVELTAAGRALLPHAREALAAAERGTRAAVAAATGALEVLRVLYSWPLEPVVLDALDRLEARDPAPSVTARGVWTRELARELREGRGDVGVLRFPEGERGLDVRPLRGDPLCALLPERRPRANAEPIELAQLAQDLPLLLWARELGLDLYNEFVLDACRALGREPEIFTAGRLDVPGWVYVRDGKAFALVGEAERAPGGTVKVPLRDALRMPVAVAWRAGAAPELLDLFCATMQMSVDALTSPIAGAAGSGVASTASEWSSGAPAE